MNATSARQAVIDTLPLFEMAKMRAATTPRRHPVRGFAGDGAGSRMRWINQFTHTRRLLGPSDREVVTPNNDTLYTNAWLDLSQGPVVIEVPAMGNRYWTLGFLDAWTNPWAYAGRRTTGGGAQKLFVHGPGHHASAPAGTVPISAPGNDVWIIGRILVDDTASDLAAVHALQAGFAIRRIDGSDALCAVDTLVNGRDAGVPDPTEYFKVVDAWIHRNPSRTHITWPTDAKALAAALPRVYAELREDTPSSDTGGGWNVAVTVRTDFGDDHLTRARVARNWIGTLGVEEAMYVMAEVDGRGEPLKGSHSYVLTFPRGSEPAVDAFWSITLYRSSDRLLVDNPIHRYSIGDRTPGHQRDPDGGLTIHLQSEDPGPGHNWLPTPPGESFYLTLRLYQPRREHQDTTYKYPPVERRES